ncbi:hypothetical protein H072_3491 [Dactylellina haptotyla CBS 200.50]|uniref:C3H1-type domain-containing protein n=1 Tax=Dactylellina haptotyla (strain CBS 200.50) TaxID=1284197 RepID=S8AHM3_DACHA|nr:hypothetical protein H072_3491 [Dactylellina haptotyla CBS 200.50]
MCWLLELSRTEPHSIGVALSATADHKNLVLCPVACINFATSNIIASATSRQNRRSPESDISKSSRAVCFIYIMANYLASIFGTEQDKVNCSFYYKIGACRHGDRCSRKHVKPSYSQTILLPNMYQNPAFDPKNKMNPSQLQNHFDAFYEDVWCEMCKYGEIEELVVCDNNNDHLIGNVYARFKYEEDAQKACDDLNNRWKEPTKEMDKDLELSTKKWLRIRGKDEREVSRTPSPTAEEKRR